MRVTWRLLAGVLVALAPPLAAGLAPVRQPAPPAPVVTPSTHSDHSPAPVTRSRTDQVAVPPGAGAPAWDGRLPPWPVGGKVFEVGPGRANKTIGQAMFLARDGDRVIVYGGQYHGQVRMQYRVWLDVRDGAEFMGHDGSAVVITAPGARVTGLTITHAGDSMDSEDAGVTVRDAPGAVVANCTISDVKFGVVAKNSPGVIIAGNTITGRAEELSLLGDGIRVWYSDGALVVANSVRHTREILVEQTKGARVEANAVTDSRQGLHLMSAPAATATRNFLGGNSTGIYVMYGAETVVTDNWVVYARGPSGYGVGVKEADGVRVEGNRLVGNRVGIYLENSPMRADKPGILTGNLLAGNDVGLSLTVSTHSNQISENNFLENLQQVSVAGQGTLAANEWTVAGRGNHWSDYAGYDAAGDGLGDVAYAPLRVFEGWMDRQPDLRWFWFTPAASAVDAAARAFPVAAPEPILTDERPLMAPSPGRESPWSSLTLLP
ncbi:MAG TPA: nitrous oxide reductase family maturation protein NosD [Symbiobacteriaceae bacterium]|nr:nitrous oxide reductase family maturation protein NosD [Symbiobacteriaceae bacterium]